MQGLAVARSTWLLLAIAARPRSGTRKVACCGGAFHASTSDPVFSRLLAGDQEKGFCDVVVEGAVSYEASYLRNTAIVQTIIRDQAGNALSITDFTPRFLRYERVFNPAQIFRRIEPLAGLPRIKIRVRPTFNYGGEPTSRAIGSNHMRFTGWRRYAARHHRCGHHLPCA